MNLMGMGIPEIGVIVLVAFLVLGPGRSIDMARSAGKLLGDLRRSFNDVTRAMTVEADQLGTTQSRKPESPVEPPPGVPVRPDTPPEDEDESDGPNTAPPNIAPPNPKSPDSESVDKG